MPDQGPAWLWPLLAAPFVGSFMGVLIARLPAGEPVGLDRSRCAKCGVALEPHDLVPLLSFALTRGRCRHCGGPIGLFHPAIELAALAVAVCAVLVEQDPDRIWIDCGLGWTLLTLGWIDQVSFLLPDVLTLPLVIAGLAVTWADDPGEVAEHALAAAGAFLVFQGVALGYRRLRGIDGLGGGDAKLFAAAGAWCGLPDLPAIVFLSAMTGLGAALVSGVRTRRWSARMRIPFGPCIAFAFWLAWLLPGWIDRLLFLTFPGYG